MNVSRILTKWFEKNKRELPWRESRNPYFIWLSEIILQQTRVQYGKSYYYAFINNYPNVFKLADAPQQEILKLWQGLGYYSRARNLHKAAVIIVEKFGGKIPDEVKDLKSLPGIGEYTAGAIASLAYGKPETAIDGNVYRVLSRFYGVSSGIDTGEGKREFKKLAEAILDKKNPGMHNQAMIELGALICLPRNPNCLSCPINSACFANKENMQYDFPKKEKATKIRHRFFYYMVIRKQKSLFLNQRKTGDIWALLYDFPVIESEGYISVNELLSSPKWKDIFKGRPVNVKNISEEHIHKLSHQHLHAFFLEVQIPDDLLLPEYSRINDYDMEKFPLPRLIDKYLSENPL